MRWIDSASAVVADLISIGTEPPLPVKMTQNCQFRQRHDRKTSETEPLAERQPVDMRGFITAGGLGWLRSVFVASKAGQIRWVTRSGFGQIQTFRPHRASNRLDGSRSESGKPARH